MKTEKKLTGTVIAIGITFTSLAQVNLNLQSTTQATVNATVATTAATKATALSTQVVARTSDAALSTARELKTTGVATANTTIAQSKSAVDGAGKFDGIASANVNASGNSKNASMNANGQIHTNAGTAIDGSPLTNETKNGAVSAGKNAIEAGKALKTAIVPGNKSDAGKVKHTTTAVEAQADAHTVSSTSIQ